MSFLNGLLLKTNLLATNQLQANAIKPYEFHHEIPALWKVHRR